MAIEWVSIPVAAERLGVSTDSLYRRSRRPKYKNHTCIVDGDVLINYAFYRYHSKRDEASSRERVQSEKDRKRREVSNAEVSYPIETSDPEAEERYFDYLEDKRKWQAKLAEIKYKEQCGQLVRADVVRAEAHSIARLLRDTLLAIPDRLAGSLASETDQTKCYEILNGEIRKVLDEATEGIDALRETFEDAARADSDHMDLSEK